MDATPPPPALNAWLECAFWVMGFGFALVKTAKAIRGPSAEPPNQQLQASHIELGRRITAAEDQLGQLWNTMRAEDTSIRDEMATSFKAIERSLGRIEGAIEGAITKHMR